MIKIAINGLGRIGRASLKIALEKTGLNIVAVNDLAPARILSHLLKYDSVYGIYPYEVEVKESGISLQKEGHTPASEHFIKDVNLFPDELIVNKHPIKVFSQKDPRQLPWKELDIDVVLECTGRFVEDGAAKAHLEGGARRVIISAPAKGSGEVQTYLVGVNAEAYQKQPLISNASCTTNCVAPVTKVMVEQFGVEKATMTTIHAVTTEQNLVDGPPPLLHPDLRRGRAALNNIVPTTTGAATATAAVIPALQDRFDGVAMRVPVLCGSITDFTFITSKNTTIAEVNQAFIKAEKDAYYKDVLATSAEPLVSNDIIGNPHSAIVDLTLTKVISGNLVKVLAWYDNEWGYSSRLVELAIEIGQTH